MGGRGGEVVCWSKYIIDPTLALIRAQLDSDSKWELSVAKRNVRECALFIYIDFMAEKGDK